jgi:translation initiation factor 2 alpha subunit (eIF-2alpha)
MPDKVEITDMELFLSKANSQMVTVVPESIKPDLTKIKAFVKMTTKVPEGVSFIQGKEEFKLSIRNCSAK